MKFIKKTALTDIGKADSPNSEISVHKERIKILFKYYY